MESGQVKPSFVPEFPLLGNLEVVFWLKYRNPLSQGFHGYERTP